MCSEGMGAVRRVLEVVTLGEMCFEGMGAVEKGVAGGGTGLNVY